MTGIARNLRVNTVAIGGMPDHIHMLIAESARIPISTVLQKVKAGSSKWLGKQVRGFAWQEGFGAFGVSVSHRNKVIAYIRNQPEHHKKRSFEEEFSRSWRLWVSIMIHDTFSGECRPSGTRN